MRRLARLIGLMLVSMTILGALVGCGAEDSQIATSGIVINEELALDAVIVDDFDENLYSVTELKAMMDAEAADYNALNGAGRVVAGEATVTEGKVNAKMTYASAEDYAAFNNRYMKIVELQTALNDGGVSVALKNVKDDSIVNPSNIEDTEALYLVVTDEIGTVSCPGNIVYISDGVEVNSKKNVTVTDNMDGLAYIIFKMK